VAKKCSRKSTARRSFIIVENLRFIQKKKLRCCFAKELASLGDIYVNDALEQRIVHMLLQQ
jgi:3-phosphoglycerate kinase